MINNDSEYEDILQDNCTQINNSLCWSDDSYQEYLYYTQVQCAVSYVIFKYFLILQVSNYEVLVILINGILMLSGVFGNILVCLSVATNNELRTLVNILLVNLAIADILVLTFCAPFSILQAPIIWCKRISNNNILSGRDQHMDIWNIYV